MSLDSVKTEFKCKTHIDVTLEDDECGRCGGNGYTEQDIEDMNNPVEWHNTGNCWQCKGTGMWKKSLCWKCQESE